MFLKVMFQIKYFLRKLSNKSEQMDMKLFYFGHHKCASKWIHGILNDICIRKGLRAISVDSPDQFGENFIEFMTNRRIDFLSFVNADYDFIERDSPFKGVHVIRDPRDLTVSAYFSHLYSHSTVGWPALQEHRKKLLKLPKNEGLFCDMEFMAGVFEQMGKWNYSNPNVLELKMENLIKNPLEEFANILSFLRLSNNECKSVSKIALRKILNNWKFEKLSSGRSKGNEDIYSHYRKGESGDWKNHFDEFHIQYFKEKYSDLIDKLGYESF